MQNASYQSVGVSAPSGYAEKTGTPPSPVDPIDWETLANVTPALLNGLCWLVWVLFLVIPALSGAHGTAAYSALQNGFYVAMGLVFCMTISVLLRYGAGVRAMLFALVLFVLAYWF